MGKFERDRESEDTFRRVTTCMGRVSKVHIFFRLNETGERTETDLSPCCWGCENEKLCEAMRSAARRIFNQQREDKIRAEAERSRRT